MANVKPPQTRRGERRGLRARLASAAWAAVIATLAGPLPGLAQAVGPDTPATHASGGFNESPRVPAAIHASRAITLTPHITELVFAAGAGSHIVATVISSDYPPAAAGIPKIGDGLNVSLEKALTLNPDLVIGWHDSGAARTLAPSLARLHIPLIYSSPKTLADIPEQILRFGQIFNTQATAGPAARALRQRIHSLQEKYAHAQPVTVFIEVGASPLYTIGRDPLLNNVLHTCGGVNLFAGTQAAAPQIDAETLIVKQPDVIITTEPSPARYRQRIQDWTRLQLAAARNHHVYNVNPDWLFRPGPRLVDAAEALCADLDEARRKQQ